MVTQKTIAERLNLSVATVSRALDGSPQVSERTRDRVMAMANQLGYVPEQYARHVSRQRPDTVALVIRTNSVPVSWYFKEVLIGLEEEMVRRRMNLMLSFAPPDRGELRGFFEYLSGKGQLAGILVYGESPETDLPDDMPRSMPPVALLNAYPEEGDDWGDMACVGPPNFEAGYKLGRELVKLGHRRFGYVLSGRRKQYELRRLEGLRNALRENGLELPDDLIAQTAYRAEMAGESVWALLDRPEAPTAVVAASDELAEAVMMGLRLRGTEIPSDVSVAGFNNSPDSCNQTPPLTTVDLHPREIGRLGARLIHRIDEDPEAGETRRLKPECEVILRESCAAPRVTQGQRQRSTAPGNKRVQDLEREVARLKHAVAELSSVDQARRGDDVLYKGTVVLEDGSVTQFPLPEGRRLPDTFSKTGSWKLTEGPVVLFRESIDPDGEWVYHACRKLKADSTAEEGSEVLLEEKATGRLYLRRIYHLKDDAGKITGLLGVPLGGRRHEVMSGSAEELTVHSLVIGCLTVSDAPSSDSRRR